VIYISGVRRQILLLLRIHVEIFNFVYVVFTLRGTFSNFFYEKTK